MLNEIKEVESYLCTPRSVDTRLGIKLLTDNFKGDCKLNGIADILTLVASHYLFDVYKFHELNRDVEKMTILIMRIWCGFENDVMGDELKIAKEENREWFKKYPQAEGWLRVYHDQHLKGKTCNWEEYSNKWKKTLNSKYLYQAESLCFENILAQAIARGPLQEYYLVIKKKYEDAIKNDIRDKNRKGKILDSRKQKTILKLLAAYKILQKLHPRQSYVLMQTNRILNWLGYESDNKERWCLDLTWCGEQIFFIDSDYDFKKMSVNQKFLNEMDVHLQEASSTSILSEYDIYQDTGYGKKNGLIKLLNI